MMNIWIVFWIVIIIVVIAIIAIKFELYRAEFWNRLRRFL